MNKKQGSIYLITDGEFLKLEERKKMSANE